MLPILYEIMETEVFAVLKSRFRLQFRCYGRKEGALVEKEKIRNHLGRIKMAPESKGGYHGGTQRA